MSAKLKREIKVLHNAVFGSDECTFLNFVKNNDGFLIWKDIPYHVRQSIREHKIALLGIHLKPGEWKQRAYENLTQKERDILTKAFRIIDKITIKDGEELEMESIH